MAAGTPLIWMKQATDCSGVCFACSMNSKGAPTLYHGERTDGTGSSLMSMMNTAAYAAKRGWNYGGIIRNSGARSSARELLGPALAGKQVAGGVRMTGHGQAFDPVVEFFLGTRQLIHETIEAPKNRTLVIKLKRKYSPAHGGSAPLIEEMTTRLKDIKEPMQGISTIVVPGYFMDLKQFGTGDGRNGAYDDYYTAQFRSALRASAACSLSKQQTWYFRAGQPWVAMHVRRGDVTSSRHPDRFTSDQYYYNVARVVRQHLPDADIHVFSSTRDQFRRGEKNHTLENAVNRDVLHSARSFQGYRERNMTVHLDGDPLVASAHLMTAHVAVLAKSAFSWAPAAFNPHCIIYQDFSFHSLAHWSGANDRSGTNFSHALPDCLTAARKVLSDGGHGAHPSWVFARHVNELTRFFD